METQAAPEKLSHLQAPSYSLFTVPRLLLIVLVSAGLLFFAAGALLFIAYGLEGPAAQARIEGLSGPASIDLYEEIRLPPVIHAAGNDVYRALGYAQATRLTWPLLLWRQAARARLGAWMGSKALPLDRHAALIGFDDNVAARFQSLSEADQQALIAFSEGVTAGLQQARTRDRFVAVLGITPDVYTPEDVLAVERLFAWLSTTVTWPDSVALPVPAQAFLKADTLFRRAVASTGWDDSAAWTYRDSSTALLTARYVTGASALPMPFESVLSGSPDSVFVLTIPGTPFPLLRAGSSVLALTPRGQAQLVSAPGENWQTHYARLSGRGESTFPFARQRADLLVALSADTTVHDTWALQWSGHQGTSDAAAWLSIFRGIAPTTGLSLLPASTLLSLDAGSGSIVFGEGQPYARGLVAAQPKVQPFLQARLDTLSATPPNQAGSWYADATSTWARALRRQLAARIDTALLAAPHQFAAFDYLANWDGAFESSSIGASVFEAFSDDLEITPFSPATALADTSAPFARARYSTLFAQTADSLYAHYGSDQLGWRWERVHPDSRVFPLWSVAKTLNLDMPMPRFFRSFTLPATGHPTTLRWGASEPGQSGAAYVITAQVAPTVHWNLYRLHLDPTRAFERFRLMDRRILDRSVRYPVHPENTITLLPF